jgi:MFS family permease
MASAVGTIIGPILGGTLYDVIGVQNTVNIFAASSLFMAFLFFLMNIWPGFLLTPKLDLPESNSLVGDSAARLKAATEEKAYESRIVKSIRGSQAIDLALPVTMEHKKYLAGIDEDEDDELESDSS